MLSLKQIFLIMSLTVSGASASAQSYVQLPAPSREGGLSVMESIWNRHSDREFSDKQLSEQEISDLLFAASGINRPDGKLTAPTALNTQEIDLYLFDDKGVFKYIPEGHKLQKVADGDHRQLIAGTPEFSQDFVLEAPVSLLIVANPDKFEQLNDRSRMMAIADAGIMCENVCLYCAGTNLATVPRATMDSKGLSKLLNLGENAIPALNLPVGYHK